MMMMMMMMKDLQKADDDDGKDGNNNNSGFKSLEGTLFSYSFYIECTIFIIVFTDEVTETERK